MCEVEKYIRFDWAIKRLLRDKANFDILEGFFTVLLGRKITITECLESESNQQTITDKFNRVDMMVKDESGEIFIVEVQLSRDLYFMQRILFGTSKVITEHIKLGESYKDIKKVYSINIIYFDLGKGKDYLYHGTTTFRGVFQNDELDIVKRERDFIDGENVAHRVNKNIFPEYYLIRVNQFNEVAKTPIEEWIDFLKQGNIKHDTQTLGLQEAREKLRVAQMSANERQEYFDHLDALATQNDTIENYKKEGEAIGLKKGERQKTLEIAKNMKSIGLPTETIIQATGLSKSEIENI